MIGNWVTITEAADRFDVTRRTIDRWRQKYPIREARLTKRHPIMLHVDDLAMADLDATLGNPTVAMHDV